MLLRTLDCLSDVRCFPYCLVVEEIILLGGSCSRASRKTDPQKTSFFDVPDKSSLKRTPRACLLMTVVGPSQGEVPLFRPNQEAESGYPNRDRRESASTIQVD